MHLYYAPLLGASGFASGVSGNAGLWGAELTYEHIIPIKPPVVLVVNPFAGYGEQYFNESTTGLLGNPINFNETTGGFYAGLNATLPLSPHWFLTGGITWYPSGFANIGVNAPVEGLSSSGTAGANQLWENVSITYSTADHWNFTLGYQWVQVWINSVPLPITTRSGLTLGGTVCPCNLQLSGFLFSLGKSF